MITREILLDNGFKFREYEDSNFPGEVKWTPEGEYTKTIDGNKFISISYSRLFKWKFEILNTTEHIRFIVDCQDVIHIDKLNTLIAIANIPFKLKKH